MSINKKIRVFIKVDAGVTQLMMNTPMMLPGDRPFLDFLIEKTHVGMAEVAKPFSVGSMKQITGITVPLFVYYINRSEGRHTVAIHDFEGFGEITVHPTDGHLVIAVDYSEVSNIVYPLHEAIDAVRVEPSEDGRELVIDFISVESPTTLKRSYQGVWREGLCTLPLGDVLKSLEKSS